jgi:hypothetical protein
MTRITSTAVLAVAALTTAASTASAQVAPAAADFSVLSGVRTAAIVDDSGRETTGRLVRVTPQSLTLKVDGHEQVFEFDHVTTVHEVGDPLTNGLIIGLLIGGSLGVVGGAFVMDCGGPPDGLRACTSTDRSRNAAIGGAVYGAIGLGIGAVVDKAIGRRTLRYARAARPGAATVSVAPSIGPAGARLFVIAAW